MEARHHELCANLRRLKASVRLKKRSRQHRQIAGDDRFEGIGNQESIDKFTELSGSSKNARSQCRSPGVTREPKERTNPGIMEPKNPFSST
jgi:hypothetical protein